jgi:hypothetical protein
MRVVKFTWISCGSGKGEGGGGYLRGFEGVVCWEVDCEEEYSAGVWTVALRELVLLMDRGLLVP